MVQLQQFLSAAADWVWETDTLHRFTSVRPAANSRTDIALDALVGHSPTELAEVNTGENDLAAENCLRKMNRHERLNHVPLVMWVSGEARSVRISGVPSFDDTGSFLGYRGVGRWEESQFPARSDGVAEPSRTPSSTAAPLLLVDDSETNRKLAESILNRMGYEVVSVDGGAEAVEAVRNRHYAAVLMDVWMPGMDGFEATAAIRNLPAPRRDIPVVAITAHTGEDERRRCLEAGMDEHVGKPIDRAILAAVLRKLAGAPTGEAVSAEDADHRQEASAEDALVNNEILDQIRTDAGPTLVNQLVGAYMAETDERLLRIRTALEAGNFEEIAADAHSMKSSSGTFGAVLLQALSASLETAAIRRDSAVLAEIHERLPELVSRTWAAFEARGFKRS